LSCPLTVISCPRFQAAVHSAGAVHPAGCYTAGIA